MDVVRSGKGQIVPFKWPSSSCSHTEFVPCEYCRALFVKSCLWKHKKNCPHKSNEESVGRHRCQGAGSLLLPFSSEATENFKRDVMGAMVQDYVVAAARVDDLIMKFGSRLYFRHTHLQHRWQYIRERVRQMGRLLLQVRSATEAVKSLSDCIVPEHFATGVESVRCLCGFDNDSHAYTTPSLALKFGHSLRECARMQLIIV